MWSGGTAANGYTIMLFRSQRDDHTETIMQSRKIIHSHQMNMIRIHMRKQKTFAIVSIHLVKCERWWWLWLWPLASTLRRAILSGLTGETCCYCYYHDRAIVIQKRTICLRNKSCYINIIRLLTCVVRGRRTRQIRLLAISWFTSFSRNAKIINGPRDWRWVHARDLGKRLCKKYA